MKIHQTKRFEQHINDCIRELSSALLVAQHDCTGDEFNEIKKTIGDIIARADALLHQQYDDPDLKR